MMTGPTHSEIYDRGIKTRRAVLGGKHVDKSLAQVSEFFQPAQELVTGYCRGAINNGVTIAEMQEIPLQTAVYAGEPTALESFRVAEKMLRELEQDV